MGVGRRMGAGADLENSFGALLDDVIGSVEKRWVKVALEDHVLLLAPSPQHMRSRLQHGADTHTHIHCVCV